MYVLQLDPTSPRAWQFGVSWSGYFAGIGYTDKKKRAIRFRNKREAYAAMFGIFVGLNGCMKVVKA